MGISGGPYIVRDSSLVLDVDPLDRNSVTSGSSSVYNLTSIGGSGSWNQPQNINYSSSYFTITSANNYLNNIATLSGSNFPQKSGSISMWINMPTYSFTNTGYFDMYDSGRNHFFIRPGGSGGIQIAAQSSTDILYQASFGETTVESNKWYNLVITYVTGVSNSIKYYLNGVLKGSGVFVSSSWTPSDQYVGYGNSIGSLSVVTGSYGPLSIYNRDLSTTEILQNYNQLKSRFNL